MSDLTRQERTAIETLAKRFPATRQTGADPHGAFILAGGKRVALDIRTLKRRATGKQEAAKPRLRFDKVVIWLLEGLRSTFDEIVPDGMTVLLTVTAPIRLPSKTASVIEEKTRSLLQLQSPPREKSDTIYGNCVRIRLWKHGSRRAPKFIGFVHNPESDARLLLNLTQDLLALLTTEPLSQDAKPAGDRWLVVTGAGARPWLAAYRSLYAQAPNAADFGKALIVFDDWRAADLSE